MVGVGGLAVTGTDISRDEERALLTGWFDTTAFDSRSTGLPTVDREPDDPDDDTGAATVAAAEEPPDGDTSAAIQAAWSAAVAALLAQWPALSAPLIAALAAQAVAVMEFGGVSALGGLAAPPDVLATLSDHLTRRMAQVASDAARQAAAEARAQGVDASAPEPDTGKLAELAAVTVALIASGFAATAARRALQAGPEAAARTIRAVLTDMAGAERGLVADSLGAALTAAQNLGRVAVFTLYPPILIRASEVNDKARCKPCTEIDGREWTSVTQALKFYPTGGYRGCEGGLRCRGFLVARWGVAAAGPTGNSLDS